MGDWKLKPEADGYIPEPEYDLPTLSRECEPHSRSGGRMYVCSSRPRCDEVRIVQW